MFLKCTIRNCFTQKYCCFFQEKPLVQKIKAKECEDSKWQIKMYDPYLIGIPWHSSLFCGRERSCRRAIHSRSEGGANIWIRLTRSRPDRQSIRDTFLDKSQNCFRRDTSPRRRWWSGLPTCPASIPETNKSVRMELPARLLTLLFLLLPVPTFPSGEFRSRLETSKGGWCRSSHWTKRRESDLYRDLLWKAEKKSNKKKWISKMEAYSRKFSKKNSIQIEKLC